MLVVPVLALVLIEAVLLARALGGRDFFAAKAARAKAQNDRMEDGLIGLVRPLVWTWDLVSDIETEHPEFVARVKAYLTSAFSLTADGLGSEDVEMAEIIEHARAADPPRRIPKYPQVPPYLATPEDAVMIPKGPRPSMAEFESTRHRKFGDVATDYREEGPILPGDAHDVNAEIEATEKTMARGPERGIDRADVARAFDLDPDDLGALGDDDRIVVACEDGHQFEHLAPGDPQVGWPCPTCTRPLHWVQDIPS